MALVLDKPQETSLDKILKGVSAAKTVFGIGVDLSNLEHYVRQRKLEMEQTDPESELSKNTSQNTAGALSMASQLPGLQGTREVLGGAAAHVSGLDNSPKQSYRDITLSTKPLFDVVDRSIQAQSSLPAQLAATQQLALQDPNNAMTRSHAEGYKLIANLWKQSPLAKDPAVSQKIDEFVKGLDSQDAQGKYIKNGWQMDQEAQPLQGILSGKIGVAALTGGVKQGISEAQIQAKHEDVATQTEAMLEANRGRTNATLEMAKARLAQSGYQFNQRLTRQDQRIALQANMQVNKDAPLVLEAAALNGAQRIQEIIDKVKSGKLADTEQIRNSIADEYAKLEIGVTSVGLGQSERKTVQSGLENDINKFFTRFDGVTRGGALTPESLGQLQNEINAMRGAHQQQFDQRVQFLQQGSPFPSVIQQKADSLRRNLIDRGVNSGAGWQGLPNSPPNPPARPKINLSAPSAEVPLTKFSNVPGAGEPSPSPSVPMVPVISPQGVPGSIPAEKLPEALKRGFKKR